MNHRKIGCYYHTSWKDKQSWKNVRYDTPLLGHYSCYDKQALKRQIDWALEHGISFFVVNWYWNRSSEPAENRIVETLLEAAAGTGFTIGINWCTEQYSNWLKIRKNWRYGDIRMETLEATEISECLKTAASKFFIHKNFLQFNERPMFYMYWANFILEFFGKQKLAEIIDGVRRELLARDVDVYLVAVDQSATGEMIEGLSESGFDAVTYYGIPSTLAPWVKRGDKLVNESTYEELIREYQELWRTYIEASRNAGIRFIPPVIAGYDNHPRHLDNHSFLVRRTGANPGLFRKLCVTVEAQDMPTDELLVNAWNEWEESSAVEPSEKNGFAYLRVIQEQLATSTGSG